jgi:hypothetical protein
MMGGGGAAKIALGKKRRAKQERAQKEFCLSKEEKKAPKDNVGKSNIRDYGWGKTSGKPIARRGSCRSSGFLAMIKAEKKELEISSFRNSCQGARVHLKTNMIPALIFVTWAGFGCLFASPPTLPTSSVRVAGTHIVNEQGKSIALRGINFGSWLVEEIWMMPVEDTPPAGSSFSKVIDHASLWETFRQRFGQQGVLQIRKAWRDCWITREDFLRVKELGLNCVRLPFLYDSLEAPDGLFPRIDQAVAWARETGVYLILDLHGTPGRQSGQHHTGKSDEDQLFKDSEKVKECELVWKKVASRYGKTPEVAAFDLMNEPMGAPNESTLYLVYDRLLRAVREVAAEKPVIIADGYKGIAGMPYPEAAGWKQVIFSQHHYNFGAKQARDHWGPLENLVAKIGYARSRRNVPFFVGEFNMEPHSSQEVMTRILDALDDKEISWTVWSYKVAMRGQGGMWGLYRSKKDLPVLNPFTDSISEIIKKIQAYQTENFEASTMKAALQQTHFYQKSINPAQ